MADEAKTSLFWSGINAVIKETRKFLATLGVHHHKSLVAFPHTKHLAKVGLKTMKRKIVGKLVHMGGLDTNVFQQAISTYRNIPHPETNISPD